MPSEVVFSSKPNQIMKLSNKLKRFWFLRLFLSELQPLYIHFSITRAQLPSTVVKIFKPVSLLHNHATRLIDTHGLFRPPCTNSTRNSTIRFAGPLIWNNLPHAIKSSSTISVFKKPRNNYYIIICLLVNNLVISSYIVTIHKTAT